MSTERRRRRRHRPVGFGDRVRRLWRKRPGTVVAFGLVLLGLVWVGWSLWSTSRALDEASDSAEVMRAALVRGDAEGAREALARYQDAVGTAESNTDGPTWSVLQVVPGIGDDLEGIEVLSGVLADLGRDGLPPLVDAAEDISSDAFKPTGHVFPIKQIAALRQPAERSEAAFDQADATLAAVDSSSFVGGFRVQFEELKETVGTARSSLGSVYRASRLIPGLLGSERPRNLLLVLQNNAEARSTGGLAGALTMVHAENGTVEVVKQGDAADLGNSAESILALTKEEKKVFGPALGRFPVNATLTPDFARAADLLRVRWELTQSSRLDGVVFVDPVGVSYLMGGTGGIVIPGYPAITASTVVASVENEIYQVTDDRRAHSDYQQKVSKAVFDAFADGAGDSVGTLTGLVRAVQEGRVRMHLFDEAEQKTISGTDIAGEFTAAPGQDPQVGIFINDAGPTKMQYYLKYGAYAVARSCDAGRQTISGEINFYNATPTDVDALSGAITGKGNPDARVEPGSQLLAIYLTTPVGGEVVEIALDGKVVSPTVQRFAGRRLVQIAVHLDPQERRRLSYVVHGAKGQDGDVDLVVSPGASPGSSNATVVSACKGR